MVLAMLGLPQTLLCVVCSGAAASL